MIYKKKYRKEVTKCHLFDIRILKTVREMAYSGKKYDNKENFIKILITAILKKQCTKIELERETNTSKEAVRKAIMILKKLRVCSITKLVKGKEPVLKFTASKTLILFFSFLLNDFGCPQLLTALESDKLKAKINDFCKLFKKSDEKNV